jgi:diaminopimelate decarboxylase
MIGLKAEYNEQLHKHMNRLKAPFYFYDLDFLENHLRRLQELSPSWLKLWYATKANPMSAILKLIRNVGLGVDVASQGELDQALRSGVPPKMILSTGPAKSKSYMRSLLENDVCVVVVESLNQAYWLDEVAKSLNVRPKVLLRVQLSWDADSDILGGSAITPFGIEASEWPKLEAEKISSLDIQGFHVFQWGNILDTSRLEVLWDNIFTTLIPLARDMNFELKVVDLGGGLGIPYKKEEEHRRLDFSEIVELLSKLKKRHKVESEIWMELGRFAVGECGHYLAQIVDRKKVRGRELLVLEGGINHLCRPALTKSPFPCSLFRPSDAALTEFQVHGPLCTALDELGRFQLPSDIQIGDWLAFHQAGAYGFTEAMPFFLCHPLPAEVIIYKGSFMTPRTSKTSADWMI